ncbi:hypothetical protein [Dyella tabacisoli]|uniref:Uncharacterized protein n=1 Tax=Dyella tabacisoli TaxID=2282381 RepID=A0A369UH17_9GAMM|nr:hypothetical protein [Dyella tabacisoli]RDD80044.1 hypothetical protein DVJ77_19420 [Dyella tabacisoli]
MLGSLLSIRRWTTEIKGDDLWFHFHLETDKYNAERHIEDDESVEYPSDWEAPIVWGNYHSCIISSNSWHFCGFKVCALKEYSLGMLDGLLLHLDPLPCDMEDPDRRVFRAYLLGHDTVVDHHIEFSRIKDTNSFAITWRGKIALTYAGYYEPAYEFAAKIHSLEAPEIGPASSTG